LLFSGQRALNELFPGFEQEPLRAGLDVRVERPGYDPFPHRDLGWSGYAASLSGHGSVGNAKWRGGHPRAL